MKGTSICEVCKNEFSWTRYGGRNTPRFCSHECRLKVGTGFRPGGQIRISELTNEEKLDRLKKSFEKHVVKQDGCWDWKGSINRNGYTVMSCRKEIGPITGHKASWVIHKGSIPQYMHVCHTCDNRRCTNPDHLWIGTHKENNDDKISKGRARWAQPPHKVGSDNGASKLVDEEVKKIKMLIESGRSCYSISKEFSVSSTTIKRIKNGINWSHITI